MGNVGMGELQMNPELFSGVVYYNASEAISETILNVFHYSASE